jgi:hypothetical protein
MKVHGGYIDMTLQTDSSTTYGVSIANQYDGEWSDITVIDNKSGAGGSSWQLNLTTGVYTHTFKNISMHNIRMVGTDLGDAVTTSTFINADVQQFLMRYCVDMTIIGGAIQWSGSYNKNLFDIANCRAITIIGTDIETNTNAVLFAHNGETAPLTTGIRMIGCDLVNFNGTKFVGGTFGDYYEDNILSPFLPYSSTPNPDYTKVFMYGKKIDYTLTYSIIQSYASNNNQLILQSGSKTGTGSYSGLLFQNSSAPSNPIQMYVAGDNGNLYINGGASNGPINGIVLTTPDGTKKYAININNSGTLTTTLTT